MYINEKHKQIVENRGYGYIGSYKCGETTIDGKCNKTVSYLRVKCPYCKKEYDVVMSLFKNRGDKCSRCCNKYENSLAYYIEVELDEPIEKYWDFEKNTVNPYHIHKKGDEYKFWIKCTKKDYHESYQTTAYNFSQGKRCPLCVNANGKVHPKDSFGSFYPHYVKYWSDKNKKSPFEVTPNAHMKYWFKCEDCGKLFERNLYSLIRSDNGCKCPSCSSSEGEYKINKFLLNNKIYFKTQKTFDDLFGISSGLLSYDFYLHDYNLLIEFQGEQHEHINGFHKNHKDFEKQLEHDRRKFNYAVDNGYNILYLYYWEINELEQRLIEELQIEG